MKFRFLFILIILLGIIACNKDDNNDDELPECLKLHYGQLTLINLSGYELAYNFPNGEDMERYGILPDSATVQLDIIYSGWFNLNTLNNETGEVKKYMITIVDCNETVFALR